MTDVELMTLLRPHVQRIAAALRDQVVGEHPYAPGVQTFSAGSSDLTLDDAKQFADYFAADDDGHFPGHLHSFFGCSPKTFANHTGLVKKQITDKNGHRVWHWVKRQVTGSPAPQKPAPQKQPAPQPAPAHEPAAPSTTAIQPAADPNTKPPGKLARAKTAAVEKLSKTKGGRAALAVGGRAVKIFQAVEHKAMFAAKKVQQVAAQAVEERGFPPERAEKLKHALYAADFLGGYVTGAAAVAAGAPAPVIKGVMLMPSASVVYLAYSTALNPKATLRAAKKVLKDTFAKADPNAPALATHAAGDVKDLEADGLLIADALKDAADPDLWTAVFCLAMGQTEGDTHAALALTNRALGDANGGSDDEPAGDEPDPDVFGAISDDDLATFADRKEGESWVTGNRRYTRSGGKTTWESVNKKPDAKEPAPKGKGDKAAPMPKADPAVTATEVRAQLGGDHLKLTPKKVQELAAKLDSLTVPEIQKLQKEHELKGGRTKAERIASLLDRARELKKAADKKKRADAKNPKPVDPPVPPPPTPPVVEPPAPEPPPAPPVVQPPEPDSPAPAPPEPAEPPAPEPTPPEPAPPESEKPEPKAVDWQHKDPNHPVAKAIASDALAQRALSLFDPAEYLAIENQLAEAKAAQKECWAKYEAFKKNGKGRQDVREMSELLSKWTAAGDAVIKHKEAIQKANDEIRGRLFDALKTDRGVKLNATPTTVRSGFNPLGKLVQTEDQILASLKGKPGEELMKKSMTHNAAGFTYATNFLASVVEHDGPQIEMELGYSSSGRAFQLNKSPSKRLLNQKPIVGLGIASDEKGAQDTAIHELGHLLESEVPDFKPRVKAFLEYRLGNEQPIDMSTVPGGESMKGEMVRKDQFDRAFGTVSAYYVGKVYKTGATEVVSMGLEKLHRDPVGFMAKDPEYAGFIISLLRRAK